MHKIQEVVHKFRSGSSSSSSNPGTPEKKVEKGGEKRERGEGGEGEDDGGGLSQQATGLMSALASLGSTVTPAGEATEDAENEPESGSWFHVDPHGQDWNHHHHTSTPTHPSTAVDGSGGGGGGGHKTELSSLSLITPSGLHQTSLTSRGHELDLSSSGMTFTSSGCSSGSPEKRGKSQPKNTVEYKVGKEDTLEKIAAHFDVTPSELKKLNRLTFHMVFENQVLYIPEKNYTACVTASTEESSYSPASPSSPVHAMPKVDIPVVRMTEKSTTSTTSATSTSTNAAAATSLKLPGGPADDHHNLPPPPSSAPPLPFSSFSSSSSSPFSPLSRPSPFLSRTFSDGGTGEGSPGVGPEGEGGGGGDVERFLKLDAQIISEGFEKVPGTLLVTPNTIMFEPDLMDDRVIEEGPENYGAMVYLDTVLSAAIYTDLSALCFHTRCGSENELLEKPEVYHGEWRGRSASTSGVLDDKALGLTSLLQSASKSVSNLFVRSPQKKMGREERTMFPLPPPTAHHNGEQRPDHHNTTTTSTNTIHTPDSGSSSNSTSTNTIHAPENTNNICAPVDSRYNANTRTQDNTTNTHPTDNTTKNTSSIHKEDEEEGEGGEGKRKRKGDGRRGREEVEPSPRSQPRAPPPCLLVQQPSQPETAGEEEEEEEKEEEKGKVAGVGVKVVRGDCDSNSRENDVASSNTATSNTNANIDASSNTGVDSKKREERGKGGSEGGGSSGVIDGGGGGEMRIGNIVYLPVEQTSEGEMVVVTTTQQATQSLLTRDGDDSISGVRNGVTGGVSGAGGSGGVGSQAVKHRPPPLTITKKESPEGGGEGGGGGAGGGGSSLSSGGGSAGPLSKSLAEFSPLRSSAQQQLSSLVNYAAGFFRSSPPPPSSLSPSHSHFPSPSSLPSAAEGYDLHTKMTSTPNLDPSSDPRGDPQGTQPASASPTSPERRFLSAVKVEERPELFRKISDLLPQPEKVHKQPSVYLHLRVDPQACDERVAESTPSHTHRHQASRPHYWFSVPRNRGDHLYAFFVHWRPDLYGDDDINPEDHGFVVVDRVDLTESEGDLPFLDNHFGQQISSSFKKDWEMVSREELKRRASLILDLDHNIMPDLSESSAILSDQSITELSGRLPARTVGYRWCLQYSTGNHGFSLRRLYRELAHLDSPVLLVIEDTEQVVFGAYLSDPPHLSDHFFGTGTCQLWTFKDKLQVFCWTGNNQYFIKGDDNSLAVGASEGTYGLWMDGDLYHGRSQSCSTFNNCVLSAHPDFCIKAVEAWAFLNS